jgi:hypothetical protein
MQNNQNRRAPSEAAHRHGHKLRHRVVATFEWESWNANSAPQS